MSFHPHVHILFSISLIRIMAPTHLQNWKKCLLTLFQQWWRQAKNRNLWKTRLTHNCKSGFPPVKFFIMKGRLIVKWMINVFSSKWLRHPDAKIKWSYFEIWLNDFRSILLNIANLIMLLLKRIIQNNNNKY